jgi:hypothetical protein
MAMPENGILTTFRPLQKGTQLPFRCREQLAMARIRDLEKS